MIDTELGIDENDRMHLKTIPLFALLLIPIGVFAQEEAGPPPVATLQVNQDSELDAVGD